MAENTNPTKVTAGSREFPVRLSYLKVFTPEEHENDEGEKSLKYSCQCIVSKKDKATLAAIKRAEQAVIDDYFKGKKPANLKTPLRDGDEEWEEKGEHLKGHYFFNCSAKKKPDVVSTKKDPGTGKLVRLTETEIKSGDYGRVSVNLFGFTGKSKGIGVGLNNIQFLEEGDALGNSTTADQDFGDFDDGEEGFDD